MKLDCIQVVYDLITERFLRTPGLVTKYFERIFMSFQKKNIYMHEPRTKSNSTLKIELSYSKIAS